MVRTSLNWLLIALLLYALVCAAAWLFQDRMVFLPSRPIVADPSAAKLAFEDVNLRTEDGETLHGWFVPGPDSSPTVLFFHGNAGNISHRIDSIALLVDAGASVLIIDYRGYGKSTGRPGEQGTYRDALAAWQYLVRDKQTAPGDIVIFGRSLGGGVASWLATQQDAGMLVLESTFESVPKVAAQIYPWLPVRWLSRIGYDSLGRLGSVGTPTVVMHSRDDELIGFEHGEALFRRAKNPVEFVEMVGGHNNGFLASGVKYREAWGRVVERVMGGQ